MASQHNTKPESNSIFLNLLFSQFQASKDVFHQFTEPPDSIQDPYQRHLVRLFHTLVFIFVPLAVAITLLHGYVESHSEMSMVDKPIFIGLVAVVALIIIFALSQAGYRYASIYRHIFHLCLVIGTALVLVITLLSPPPYVEILFLLFLPVMACVILSLRDAFVISTALLIIKLLWLRYVLLVQDGSLIVDYATIFVVLTLFMLMTSYQRNRLEDERRDEIFKNESHIRMLMAKSPMTMWTTNNELVIQSISGTTITDQPDRLLNRSLPKLIEESQASHTGIVEALQCALNGLSDTSEIEWRGKTYQVYIEPLRNTDDIIIGTIGVATDVSHRKRDEQMRLTVATQIERINVLQNFIEVASHDFKTPISTIITSLYVARRKHELNQDVVPYLDRIEIQTQRILDVLDSMLTMNQLDMHQLHSPKPTNLSTLLADLYGLYLPKVHSKSLDFRQDIASDIFVHGDAASLQLALSQILDNALQFTDQGLIHLSLSSNGSTAIIGIKDSGIGMTIRQTERIFERFYRGEESRPQNEGTTGLGLSVARKIVTDHGGTIDVDSEVGVGTTFTIRLQLMRQDMPNELRVESPESNQTPVHPRNSGSSLDLS